MIKLNKHDMNSDLISMLQFIILLFFCIVNASCNQEDKRVGGKYSLQNHKPRVGSLRNMKRKV